MRFTFEERRATQAAAVLLRLSGDRQNYTWLLKALYVADRYSLAKTGAPIAGASFVNMKNGPLASDVYDCIKGSGKHPFWSEHIARDGEYHVTLTKDPGDDELSDFDVGLLSATYDRFKAYSFGRMIDYVHTFGEWEDPGTTSETLLPEAILRAVGADDEQIADYEHANSHINRFDELMS
jgi:uncharacterized phage-associated protein